MIIVSGLNRKTGEVRTSSFQPGKEGPARKFREMLRSQGFSTAFVNDVKERYRLGVRCATVPLQFEGITGYQLHSLGTATGYKKDNHITKCQTDILTGAIEFAEDRVNEWSDGHKGIVIYRAIKLVRKVKKPTTEVVDLS